PRSVTMWDGCRLTIIGGSDRRNGFPIWSHQKQAPDPFISHCRSVFCTLLRRSSPGASWRRWLEPGCRIMNKFRDLLIGMAMGAGMMYLLDPGRGARRRALIRDQVVHGAHEIED